MGLSYIFIFLCNGAYEKYSERKEMGRINRKEKRGKEKERVEGRRKRLTEARPTGILV